MSTSISTQEANNEKLGRKAYDALFDGILIVLFIIVIIVTMLDIKIAVYICAAIGILILCIRHGHDIYNYMSKKDSNKETTNVENENQDDNQ